MFHDICRPTVDFAKNELTIQYISVARSFSPMVPIPVYPSRNHYTLSTRVPSPPKRHSASLFTLRPESKISCTLDNSHCPVFQFQILCSCKNFFPPFSLYIPAPCPFPAIRYL